MGDQPFSDRRTTSARRKRHERVGSVEAEGARRKSILISLFFSLQAGRENTAVSDGDGDGDGFQVLIRARARGLSRKARSRGRHHGRFVPVQPLLQITLIRLMDAVHRRWWPRCAFAEFLPGPLVLPLRASLEGIRFVIAAVASRM